MDSQKLREKLNKLEEGQWVVITLDSTEGLKVLLSLVALRLFELDPKYYWSFNMALMLNVIVHNKWGAETNNQIRVKLLAYIGAVVLWEHFADFIDKVELEA